MARNRTRAKRREARERAAGVIVAASDGALRSALGVMLWRLWLYSGQLPQYQAASLIEQGRALAFDREGNQYYYR